MLRTISANSPPLKSPKKTNGPNFTGPSRPSIVIGSINPLSIYPNIGISFLIEFLQWIVWELLMFNLAKKGRFCIHSTTSLHAHLMGSIYWFHSSGRDVVIELYRKLVVQGLTAEAMSFMKGDLLTKTKKLVKGLAKVEPLWLKAMEQWVKLHPFCFAYRFSTFIVKRKTGI